MKALRYLIVVGVLVALAAGGYVLAARRPAIDPIKPPAASSFKAALVQRGAQLAALGDCATCHTAPGGRSFAGGLAVPTPFGTIYSTNITPDGETGIGAWSEAAFRRAMREGVRRDGQYLYPAFPYDHFTLVTDDDDNALYAYLMTRTPVHAVAQADELPFPLNVRLVLFGWDLLFLRQGPYRADAGQSATFNRGAYLVEGLGHCGACHTPRNLLGAETSEKFSGGEVDGWTAYALNSSSPAPVPWTADTLEHYLQYGFQDLHGVAYGPMMQVADEFHTVPQDDVRAIAIYVVAQMGNRRPPGRPVAQQVAVQDRRGHGAAASSADSQAEVMNAGGGDSGNDDEGELVYAATCAGCHQGPRVMPYGGIDLALSSAVSAANGDNLANVVFYGLPAVAGARRPIMPGFAAGMTNHQLVALAAYLRAHFSNKGAWADIAKSVGDARASERVVTAGRAPTDQVLSSETIQRASDGDTQR
jgi:mono/diheme cytochrome c family protein